MSTTADRLARLVTPVADDLGVTVYDIEDSSGTMRVLLARPDGIDVDTLADASRRISRAMDEDGSFASAAVLEVSSPGLERKLRTAAHFIGAVGEQVKIKLAPGVADRRIDGVVAAADDRTVTVATPDGGPDRTLLLADITSAHTVFVWETTPKPGTKRTVPASNRSGDARPRSDSDPQPAEPADPAETEATA